MAPHAPNQTSNNSEVGFSQIGEPLPLQPNSGSSVPSAKQCKAPEVFFFLSEFSEGPTEAPKGGLLCWGEREGFRTPRNPDEILFQLNMTLPVWNTSAKTKHPNTKATKASVRIMRPACAFSRTPSLRLSSQADGWKVSRLQRRAPRKCLVLLVSR